MFKLFELREGGEKSVFTHLEDSDYGPEERVKVLPVWQGVSIPLWPKLTAKQMHPQDTDTGEDKQETEEWLFTSGQHFSYSTVFWTLYYTEHCW